MNNDCLQCSELQGERDRLREELATAKAERDQYLKALCALTYEAADHAHFDRKTLLGLVGKRQPLEELIAELESQGN